MNKPDYFQHEQIYQDIRREGGHGWQNPDGDAEVIQLLETWLAPAAPDCKQLIELGCGAGNLTDTLVGLGYHVDGIDISATAIAWAAERFLGRRSEVDFHVGNVVTLSAFPDRSFDVAVDSLCWHCIVGQDRADFLAAVYRVLNPGGLFVVLTMCGDPKPESLRRIFDPVTRCLYNGNTPNRYLGTESGLRGELRRAGFETADLLIHLAEIGSGHQDMLVGTARRPFETPPSE